MVLTKIVKEFYTEKFKFLSALRKTGIWWTSLPFSWINTEKQSPSELWYLFQKYRNRKGNLVIHYRNKILSSLGKHEQKEQCWKLLHYLFQVALPEPYWQTQHGTNLKADMEISGIQERIQSQTRAPITTWFLFNYFFFTKIPKNIFSQKLELGKLGSHLQKNNARLPKLPENTK